MRHFIASIIILLAFMLGQSVTLSDTRAQKRDSDKKKEEGEKPKMHEVLSKHFDLSFWGTKAEAKETSKFMETAWKSYKKFFQCEPDLKRGERLKVFVDENQEAFVERLARINVKAGSDTTAGMFVHRTNTAYVYRRWSTQALNEVILHEVGHQFHRNALPYARGFKYLWLSEGIAEVLCYHHWDGRKLSMLVIPMLTEEDHFKTALENFSKPSFTLERFLKAEIKGGYAEWHAFASWLQYGDRGKNAKKFLAMAREIEADIDPIECFEKHFGKVSTAFTVFKTWLKENQQVWETQHGRWRSLGNTALRGIAPEGYVATTTLKREAEVLSATAKLPLRKDDTWRMGVIYDWVNEDEYKKAFIDETKYIYIQTIAGGEVTDEKRYTPPAPKKNGYRTFMVERKKGKTHISVEGRQVHKEKAGTGMFGLTTISTTSDFSKIRWKFPKEKKK